MSVLVIGSVALDSVKTPSGSKESMLGGSATYFSLAAQHFTKVRLVAVIGKDFPKEYHSLLAKNSIDLCGLQIADGKTFHWQGEYSGSMNEAVSLDTQLNVFEHFNPVLPETYKDSEFLFLANIDPVLQRKVIEQAENRKFTALDTMNFWIQGTQKELLKTLEKIDLLVINETELRMLARETNLVRAFDIVQKMGPKYIIVKRGEYGSVLFHQDEYFFVPGFPEKNVIDPTGAGDSFAGGFMGSLAREGKICIESLRKSMVYGSVMASFNITSFGPWKLADLTLDQIEERFELFRSFTRF